MPVVLYRFKVRDSNTGKWRQTRYSITLEEAKERYGDGNYEPLEWSKEIRTGHAAALEEPRLQSMPGK